MNDKRKEFENSIKWNEIQVNNNDNKELESQYENEILKKTLACTSAQMWCGDNGWMLN